MKAGGGHAHLVTLESPEHAPTAAAAELSARFGVPVWWGQATCRFWAIIPGGRRGRLIEATNPHELADAISRARRPNR